MSDEELGGSYDRATFLEQRREMIQLWADLLNGLAANKAVAVVADLRRTIPANPSRSEQPLKAGERGFSRAA